MNNADLHGKFCTHTLGFFPAFLWFVRSKAIGMKKYPKIGLV